MINKQIESLKEIAVKNNKNRIAYTNVSVQELFAMVSYLEKLENEILNAFPTSEDEVIDQLSQDPIQIARMRARARL